MDKAIADSTAEWTRRQMRRAARQVQQQPAPVVPITGRKLPPPPDWWKGDEDAMRSALVAGQQLRQRGG